MRSIKGTHYKLKFLSSCERRYEEEDDINKQVGINGDSFVEKKCQLMWRWWDLFEIMKNYFEDKFHWKV